MRVIIKILLFRSPYTICNVSEDCLTLPDEYYHKAFGITTENTIISSENEEIQGKKGHLKYTTNALFLQYFLKCLQSDVYRASVVLNLNKLCNWPVSQAVRLRLILNPPRKEILDYAWNERMLKLAWLRVDIENAFSWLSTLGGAYSALGDYFEHCAEEAGRISNRQYKLSKMLGDDALAARSKLYLSIAKAQKGHLRSARRLVRQINQFALETHDKRLHRMCLGVWAKLKYMRLLKKSQKCQGKGDSNDLCLMSS